MTVAANIKRYREGLGLTQGDLADKLGVARSTVTQWENGWSSPRMGMVQKLAGVFHVSTSDIVAEQAPAAQDTDPDFDRLARAWRGMPADNRAALLAAAESFAKHPGNVSGGGGAPWMSPRRPRRRSRMTRIPVFA